MNLSSILNFNIYKLKNKNIFCNILSIFNSIHNSEHSFKNNYNNIYLVEIKSVLDI